MSRSRLRRAAIPLVASGAVGLAVLWVLSAPGASGGAVPDHDPDPRAGETLYHLGSCQTCHRPADSAPAEAAGLPAGGAPFETPVGTFYPQNLTPDPETGLGRWSAAEFVAAMTRGVSPDGRHYFPAFPYASYRWMRDEDLLDLFAYLWTLAPVRSPERSADLPLEPLARRSVGLWKRVAFAQPEPPAPRASELARGAYLVSAPGHCGECHTPRGALMVMDAERYLAGGPHPRGEGSVPSLRALVARGRYSDAADLTFALQYGETFGYDKLSSGGMGEIQANLAKLPEADLKAMAAYLVSLE